MISFDEKVLDKLIKEYICFICNLELRDDSYVYIYKVVDVDGVKF